MDKPIYLDYNATTPIDHAVADEMSPYIYEDFGNPSSTHIFGLNAKKGIALARRRVADLLGAQVDEIIFTSGGSEANNLAIQGIAFAFREKGNHLITSVIEHPAVLEVMHYLEKNGFRVAYLPVDEYGLVDPFQVENAITPHTILISIMHANNEIGTIEPIESIAQIAHQHGVILHSDAAQSVGKIAVRVDDLGVDLLSIAGHKMYAPKGVGALYVRSGIRLERIIHGAEHEMNRRAGTENVIGIVGLGKASELITKNLDTYQSHMCAMRDLLENGLHERFAEVRFNGHPQKRLPNTCNVSFRGLEANTILSEMTRVAASAGAACHSDRVEVSPVIQALGVPTEYAMGTIRFTVGRNTTESEIKDALNEIQHVVERLQPRERISINVDSNEKIRLTQYTHGLGCACKLRPQLLEKVLQDMPVPTDKRVLVGTESSDDAAVYLINENTALVQTVDFFTPIVDNPFQFGAISAANSLSDIYAMGATPLFALNIVGFPSNRLPLSVLDDILKGALSKTSEAGISIIGGHTVDDIEPKFGLAVTGVVSPDKIITNSHAQVGDMLILTKPIGTGILTTALKQGLLPEKHAKIVIDSMSMLNRAATEAMQVIGVHACTDITGFGLLGHLLGMMRASRTCAVIQAEKIPLLPGVKEQVAAGVVPGGTKNNLDYTIPYTNYSDGISQTMKLILNDAQTSGGLLISVEQSKFESLLDLLHDKGINLAVKIGSVAEYLDAYLKVE